jgi:hypothetical protein
MLELQISALMHSLRLTAPQKNSCNDTLQQVWNRTVVGAHKHLQYVVYNLTEPYFQIAKLLHELPPKTSNLNGTDNLTGRARLERCWPRPLGINRSFEDL